MVVVVVAHGWMDGSVWVIDDDGNNSKNTENNNNTLPRTMVLSKAGFGKLLLAR